MRTFMSLQVIVSEDDDQLAKLVPDVDVTIDDSSATTYKASVYTLAGGSGETQYSFSPEVVHGKYIMLQVLLGTVTVKFNVNTAPAIGLTIDPATAVDPVLPYQVTPQPGVMFIGPITLANPLTSLWIHNTDGSNPARIAIALVGEAV